ncbi:MAG TPA: radical SAM protein [Smithella sp.]|nr:radical SAM protein [Smithella sp.]
MIIANSGEVPLIEDLDSLPVPAYDLIDLPFYWKETRFFLNSGSRYASLFSSRGCPYKCFYCHRIFGKQFRYQSAERIVSEIKYLKKKYNINDIEFLDDVFNLYRPRMIDFCEKLPRQVPGIKIALPNGVRTDILKFEDIDALAEAGLYYCSFALESGSPRIQKLIGKELDISKFKKNVDYAAKKRIFTNGFTMLGFPSETGSDIQMTIDAACNSLLHLCSFFTATPFANTVMYEMAKSRCPERLARLRYDNMEYGDVFINLSDVPDEELFRYQREAWRRFYLKPSRIMRIIRDYPNPLMIPFYVPILLKRLTRGLFRKSF